MISDPLVAGNQKETTPYLATPALVDVKIGIGSFASFPLHHGGPPANLNWGPNKVDSTSGWGRSKEGGHVHKQ